MSGRPPEPIDESSFPGQVGARIRARRERLKLTVPKAAERAGSNEQTWYNWEVGRHLPLDRLPAIAEALGCKVRTLIPD